MMVQDLSPSRVVAASAEHARAVVVSTTHLPMAKAGPWTVRVPTHGRCRAHVVRCPRHSEGRGFKLRIWMMLQDLSPSRVVAASAVHASAMVASTTHLPMDIAGPCTVRVPTHGRVALTSYGVHATARAVDAS